VVCVLTAATLWGTTGTAAALAPGVGPLAIGAAAMGVGGLLQALAGGPGLLAHRGALLARWRLVLLGATAIAVYPLAFYTAMRMAGVAIGTVVTIGCAPVAAAVIERVVDRQPLSRRWLISAAAGIAGVIALSLSHHPQASTAGSATPGWRPVLGIVLGVVAAMTYALYSWVAARLMRGGIPAGASMGALFGPGGLLLVPVLIMTGGKILGSVGNVAVVAYLGVVPMFLGYVLFGRGLARVSASTATTVSLLEPVVATAIAIMVLDEHLSTVGWLGMALILSGLAVLTAGSTGQRSIEAVEGAGVTLGSGAG
jgi:DME family drug/metabolite transporter